MSNRIELGELVLVNHTPCHPRERPVRIIGRYRNRLTGRLRYITDASEVLTASLPIPVYRMQARQVSRAKGAK